MTRTDLRDNAGLSGSRSGPAINRLLLAEVLENAIVIVENGTEGGTLEA